MLLLSSSWRFMLSPLLFAALMAVPLLSVVLAAEPPATVQRLQGEPFPARLRSIQNEQLRFFAGDQEQAIPFTDFMKWGQPAEKKPGSYLLLRDGGVIVAEVKSISHDHITFASSKRPGMWQENRLPREEVRAIVFQSPWLPQEREQLEAEWLSAEEPAAAKLHDRLLFLNGDSLSGKLLRADRTEAEADDGLTLRFQPTAGAAVEIKQPRVKALLFPTIAAVRPSVQASFWLGLRDGSCLCVESCEPKQDRVQLRLPSQTVLLAQARDAEREPALTFFDRVVFVQAQHKRVAYLSDLPSLGFKHVPLLAWETNYRQDRALSGAALRAGTTRYLKGVSMPATSRLAYEIPLGAIRFESEVSIAASAKSRGSCLFRVYLETAAGAWQVAQETSVLRAGEATQTLRVDVGEAKRLALVVEMADQGDVCDDAQWLDARFLLR